jgi:hypothetical protein
VRFDAAWLDRLYNLAWASGRTVQQVLEDGAQREIERIERDENHGRPFKSRPMRQPSQ